MPATEDMGLLELGRTVEAMLDGYRGHDIFVSRHHIATRSPLLPKRWCDYRIVVTLPPPSLPPAVEAEGG